MTRLLYTHCVFFFLLFVWNSLFVGLGNKETCGGRKIYFQVRNVSCENDVA